MNLALGAETKFSLTSKPAFDIVNGIVVPNGKVGDNRDEVIKIPNALDIWWKIHFYKSLNIGYVLIYNSIQSKCDVNIYIWIKSCPAIKLTKILYLFYNETASC